MNKYISHINISCAISKLKKRRGVTRYNYGDQSEPYTPQNYLLSRCCDVVPSSMAQLWYSMVQVFEKSALSSDLNQSGNKRVQTNSLAEVWEKF